MATKDSRRGSAHEAAPKVILDAVYELGGAYSYSYLHFFFFFHFCGYKCFLLLPYSTFIFFCDITDCLFDESKKKNMAKVGLGLLQKLYSDRCTRFHTNISFL